MRQVSRLGVIIEENPVVHALGHGVHSGALADRKPPSAPQHAAPASRCQARCVLSPYVRSVYCSLAAGVEGQAAHATVFW